MDSQAQEVQEPMSPMDTNSKTDVAAGGDGAPSTSEIDDEDSRKLFVGGLNWETTVEKLREYFEKYGEVTEVLRKEDWNGKSRGFGFVTFADQSSLEKVLAVDNHKLEGRNIDPKHVIPRVFKIFVGALDPNLTEQEIKDHFSQFGDIIELDLPYNKLKGERRAFAFIRYKTEEAVNKALAAPKTKLGDREYEIKRAITNQRGQPGFGFARGGGYRGRNRGYNYGHYFGYGGYNYPGYGGYSGYSGGYPGYSGYEQYSGWPEYQQSYSGGGGGGSGGGNAAWL